MSCPSGGVGKYDKRSHQKRKIELEGWFLHWKTKTLAASFATQNPELNYSTRIPFETTSKLEEWLEAN